MDQTSWLDLSADGDIIPTSPSPPPSPPSSPVKLTRSRSIIERAASRASEYSISPNTSSSDDQLVGRSGLPPWDRTVDIVYHKYKHGDVKPDKSVALKVLTDKFFTLHKRQSVSFDFYATIFVTILSEYTFHVTFSPFIGRRLNPLATIWINKYGIFMKSLIIEIDLSRLGLGPAPKSGDLLPGIDHLQRLLLDFKDILDPAAEALESKDSVRASSESPQNQHSSAESSGRLSSCDISDRTSRVFSPAPEEFFEQTELDLEDDDEEEEEEEGDEDEHGDSYIDYIDSDEDYVVNMSYESSDYSSDSSFSSDSSSSPDASLAPPPSIQEEDPSYCPDKHLFICNHLLRLRNKVTSLRIAGFSDAYSHAFIATLFPEAKFLPLAQHSYRVAPSTFWPRLRGQKSWIDTGQGTLILDDHEFRLELAISEKSGKQRRGKHFEKLAIEL
ncbi:hypothetical protein TrVFT333_003482 [Trichoderma virens FT-333]|nr:hypothetical protein TrVFT333_003482 [Trichoderma virens FT-333]